MYENVGKKVQTLVKIIFCIEVILCVIIAIATLVSGDNVLYGLLVIPIGIGVSWLSYIALYAIGVAAEYSELGYAKLEELEKKLDSLSRSEAVSDTSGKNEARVSGPISPSSFSPKQTREWECPNCGTINSADAWCCKDCGKYR